MPFYTSLNTDISGTRKDIKKRSTVFFPVFAVHSCQNIKIFISYPLRSICIEEVKDLLGYFETCRAPFVFLKREKLEIQI